MRGFRILEKSYYASALSYSLLFTPSRNFLPTIVQRVFIIIIHFCFSVFFFFFLRAFNFRTKDRWRAGHNIATSIYGRGVR